MSSILIDIHQRIATITFNRPEKKNAFNREAWFALRDAIVEARDNDSASVVVITGAGKDFSSGVDLSDLNGDPNEKPPFEEIGRAHV